ILNFNCCVGEGHLRGLLPGGMLRRDFLRLTIVPRSARVPVNFSFPLSQPSPQYRGKLADQKILLDQVRLNLPAQPPSTITSKGPPSLTPASHVVKTFDHHLHFMPLRLRHSLELTKFD